MSDNYFALKAQKDRIVAAQDARVVALELGLKSFLHLFAHNEDGEPEDMLAGLSDSHAFEMIDQAAHRDVPISSATPCITVGQIRRAREALGLAKDTRP